MEVGSSNPRLCLKSKEKTMEPLPRSEAWRVGCVLVQARTSEGILQPSPWVSHLYQPFPALAILSISFPIAHSENSLQGTRDQSPWCLPFLFLL